MWKVELGSKGGRVNVDDEDEERVSLIDARRLPYIAFTFPFLLFSYPILAYEENLCGPPNGVLTQERYGVY
jgi:hypothetical protein